MGRQIVFYLTPPDIAALEARIREVEPMIVLHNQSSEAAPRVLPSLVHHEGDDPWLYFDLVRWPDYSAVRTEHIPAQRHWTVDELRSPVIEFGSCYFDGEILRRGRIYYTDGFYGEDDAWVKKPDVFLEWAEKVFRAVRKLLQKKHDGKYVGPETLEWLKKSGGRLVD